jgi:hypothetical protein
MSLKKGVDPELDPDLSGRGTDPQQNVTDPQHCLLVSETRASQMVTRIHQDLVELIGKQIAVSNCKVPSSTKKTKKLLDIVS